MWKRDYVWLQWFNSWYEISLRGSENMVSMDITHCLQQPGKKHADGSVKSGGLRIYSFNG